MIFLYYNSFSWFIIKYLYLTIAKTLSSASYWLLNVINNKLFFLSNFRSAFFWFCHDERTKVKALNPEYGVGDIAKELGRKWSDCVPETKSKYEAMADKDKQRYERVSIHYLYIILFWRFRIAKRTCIHV